MEKQQNPVFVWWSKNFKDDIKKVFNTFKEPIINHENFVKIDKLALEKELKTYFEQNAKICAEKNYTSKDFYERLTKFIDIDPNTFIKKEVPTLSAEDERKIKEKLEEFRKKYSDDVRQDIENTKKIYESEKDENMKKKYVNNLQNLEKIYKFITNPQQVRVPNLDMLVEFEKKLVQIHLRVRKPVEKKMSLKETCQVFIDRLSAMEREKNEELNLKLKKLKGENQDIIYKAPVSKKKTKEFTAIPVAFKKDQVNYNQDSVMSEIQNLKLNFINQEYYEYECKLISRRLHIYLNDNSSVKKFKIIEQNLETKESQILTFNNGLTLTECIEIYENHSIFINDIKILVDSMKKTDSLEPQVNVQSNLRNNEIQVQMDFKSNIQIPKLIVKLSNGKIVDVKFEELPVDNYNPWYLRAKKNFDAKECNQIYNLLNLWMASIEESLNV